MVIMVDTMDCSVSQDQKYLMCVTDDTVLSIFEISESETVLVA